MAIQWLDPYRAAWLLVESPRTPMHLGVLAIFERPRRASASYVAELADEMRTHQQFEAPWNQRLVKGAQLGLLRGLETAHSVDIEYHCRNVALPSPGGERELGTVVSRLHSQALDRDRPLWELHVIEGLAGGRFAFYLKIHHALLQDLNAIALVMNWLSRDSRMRTLAPLWAYPIHGAGGEEAGSGEEQAGEAARSAAADVLQAGMRAAGGLVQAVRDPTGTGTTLLPSGAPRSTLNRPINRQRRFATQQYDRARIERLAEATDSTVNDMLVYLTASSLRRFFKEYNALPDESLVAALPVRLGDARAGARSASIGVSLATDIGDPLRRLEAIKRSLAQARSDRVSLPAQAGSTYALLRAAPLIAKQLPGVGRLVPAVFNLSISTTEGSEQTRYCNGARLEAVYTMSQLMQSRALSIDCVSYGSTLNIGIIGARDTLPHLQRLAVYMGKAVDDLEELVELGGAAA